MSCPSLDQLARAAAGEGVLDRDHLAGCARCAALLEDQRQLRALAQAMRPVALATDRRAELAAEIMARADADVPAHRSRRVALAAGAAVTAIALAVLALRGDDAPSPPPIALGAEPPAIEVPARVHVREPAPPAAAPLAEVRALDAELVRDTTPERDLITLRGGRVTVDATTSRPIELVTGTTQVAIAGARATLIARAGVLEQVAVFAGSVELTEHGTRHVIVAGATWERLPPPAAPAQPASSLAAFREGWTQLRANSHAAAIAAFDRATDPVVAEDAAYWAAVAAERAGLTAEARRRFEAFAARFPASPRAEAARAALARLP